MSMKASASDLIVIATAKAKPGKEADLERVMREVAGPTRAQPGCVQFSLYRVATAPSTIVALERWASAADHDRHLQGAHVQRLMTQMADILAQAPSIISHDVLEG
jgi:quinol monooxygenase YgiN